VRAREEGQKTQETTCGEIG